jgi:hypothetical protein
MDNLEKSRRLQKVDLQFGLSGHESEYVLTTPYVEADIPSDWEDVLKQNLGNEWDIMHRQSRIEIRRKDLKHLDGDDELVRDTVTEKKGSGTFIFTNGMIRCLHGKSNARIKRQFNLSCHQSCQCPDDNLQ